MGGGISSDMDRKALIRKYKETRKTAGVFRVRNTINVEITGGRERGCAFDAESRARSTPHRHSHEPISPGRLEGEN
jgi:hypothetical protein